MTESQIELERHAKAADNGLCWTFSAGHVQSPSTENAPNININCLYGNRDHGKKLARYIAAANPQAILQLLGDVTKLTRDNAAHIIERGELQAEITRLRGGRDELIEQCAAECERMMMYPGGKEESAAHSNVWAAANAIRAMKL